MGKGKPWTETEENILKEFYKVKSKQEMINLLPNRTWKAIKNKAVSLGIRKRPDYEETKGMEKYKRIGENTYKLCRKCARYLPLNIKYFPRDKKYSDGMRDVCKECKGENFKISTAKQWNAKEVELLIKVYPSMKNEDIVKKYFPYRKTKHIKDKANALGIKKDYKTLCEIRAKSEETRLKISNARKMEGAFVGSKNPMYKSRRYKELNPNWKGGLCTERENAMRTDKYKKWRKEVFERDNFTCICCGKMTHDIEAHHLNNFAEFKEERYMVDNGVTLCKKCHNPNQMGSYHNECGTLKNTKEQFYDWLKKRKGAI